MYALAGDHFRCVAGAIPLCLALLGCGDQAAAGANSAAGAGAGSAAGDNGSAGNPPLAAGGAAVMAGGPNQGSGGATEPSNVDPGAVDCTHEGDGKTTLAFVNGCSRSVTFRGSDIDGGTLAPGAFACVDIGSDVESLSAKRYWGFSGEDPGAEHHSLAEFTFNTDFNDFDWYNISYVDAFNLPLQIVPVARPKCKTLTCAEDWLASCPAVGKYADKSGAIVACVSPDRNNADSPVAQFFEACDDAYAWSGDDQKGTDPSPVRACAGEDWNIVFCPGGKP